MIMTNSPNIISAEIPTKGQKLEEGTSFQDPGATLSNDGTCSTEIRMATAMAGMIG